MPNPTPEAAPEAGWVLQYDHYDPADEGRREAIFALGNGMVVLRAATVHAVQEPPHYPGTYRAGCYDRTEAMVEGERDETDALVNLPNPLPLELRIGSGDAPWLRLGQVELLAYAHRLDLRGGSSVREFTFRDAQGRRTQVSEQRLVSMARPQVASLRLEVTPLDWSGPLELRSLLDGRVVNANVARYLDYRCSHLTALRGVLLSADEAALQARTLDSGVEIALALRTRFEADEGWLEALPVGGPEPVVGHVVRARGSAGRTLWLEKTIALCTSLDRGAGDPMSAAASQLARAPAHAALRIEHEQAWARLWTRAGVELQDPQQVLPLRLHLFHLLQTASPHAVMLDAGIPARGWHGEAYHGHVFWDEAFILPFLEFRLPEVARASLLYRWNRLDAARAAARRAGLRGAMYPWRSAGDGREQTPRFQKNMLSGGWMRDHTRLQRHVGAAIAWSTWQYHLVTHDTEFLCDHGAEMILEIARFWASLAQPTAADGRYRILGVIGPDEYHNAYPGSTRPGLDDNAYTNVMAVWTLCCAQEVLDSLPQARREALVRRLGISAEETALWDRISRRMRVPFFGDGLIAQYEGFEQLAEFDPALLPPELREQRLDWALDAVGRSADEFQVSKQADVLTLFHLLSQEGVTGLLHRLGYAFDAEALRRTARYYLARTTHRSSLSRIVYAGALAQVEPELSWELYRQALGTDLHTLKGERVAEGIHLAAMGGTLDTLQRHYLGLSAQLQGLRLQPAVPAGLGPVDLPLVFRGQVLRLQARDGQVCLRSAPGNTRELRVAHAGGVHLLPPGSDLLVPGRA